MGDAMAEPSMPPRRAAARASVRSGRVAPDRNPPTDPPAIDGGGMALKPKDKPHIVEPTGDRPRSDTLVMFGASGDLAKKKLFPAVYRLEKRGLLGVPVIGVAFDDWTTADLVAHARAAIVEDGEEWDQAAFDRLAASMT